MFTLQSQLENEMRIRQKLVDQKREDILAHSLLRRIDIEIDQIQRKINHEKQKARQQGHQCTSPSRQTRHAKENVRRFWAFCNKHYNTVFGLPKYAVLQEKEAVK